MSAAGQKAAAGADLARWCQKRDRPTMANRLKELAVIFSPIVQVIIS
jgi:hypothetical protein